MSRVLRLTRSAPVLTQAALIAAGALTLGFWPPSEGPMMLIALDGRDGGRLVGPALNAGATLAGRGPLPNMILVNGRRAHLAPLLSTGVIALAAPRGLCSQGAAA